MLETLLRPGDVISNLADGGFALTLEIKQRTSGRALYLQPMIHMELDGWQRTDPGRRIAVVAHKGAFAGDPKTITVKIPAP